MSYVNADGKKVLTGGDEWLGVLEIIVDGDDLVSTETPMTVFAGGDDAEDNSRGAWGDDTSDPGLVAVSLPAPRVRGCGTPPLPNLPHRITVRVWSPDTDQSVEAPLLDIGPSAPPRAHAGIDGTPGLWRAIGLNPDDGRAIVRFRVLGGAQYL